MIHLPQTGRIAAVQVVTEDGQAVDIKDLPRPDYERFLRAMHELNCLYTVLVDDRRARLPHPAPAPQEGGEDE